MTLRQAKNERRPPCLAMVLVNRRPSGLRHVAHAAHEFRRMKTSGNRPYSVEGQDGLSRHSHSLYNMTVVTDLDDDVRVRACVCIYVCVCWWDAGYCTLCIHCFIMPPPPLFPTPHAMQPPPSADLPQISCLSPLPFGPSPPRTENACRTGPSLVRLVKLKDLYMSMAKLV